MQDTRFHLPEPPPEHAVIARFRLGGDDLGESDQRSLVFEAERSMGAAVKAAGVGEVDGNEFGGGEVVLFAYGPNADALYRVMEPGLRALPFRPAHVVLRYATLADPRLCAAIVDRPTFNGAIIQTGTESYRLAHTKALAEQAAAS